MSNNFDRNKLRYAILKELNEGNEIEHYTFGITTEEFKEMLYEMEYDGLIFDVDSTKDKVLTLKIRITKKGRNELKNNSIASKAYRVVKEIRDWIK